MLAPSSRLAKKETFLPNPHWTMTQSCASRAHTFTRFILPWPRLRQSVLWTQPRAPR
nr:MAG TPA: hypothetical protein [Caudoviricetes sp.]